MGYDSEGAKEGWDGPFADSRSDFGGDFGPRGDEQQGDYGSRGGYAYSDPGWWEPGPYATHTYPRPRDPAEDQDDL